MTSSPCSANGPHVLQKQYGCTSMETDRISRKSVEQYVLTSPVPSLYHCRPRRCARFLFPSGCSSEGSRMDSGFKTWIGQPVILQLALGDIKVPLRGKLLKDGDETVRMRIGEGWDVDIYKVMILAVEQDAMVLLPA